MKREIFHKKMKINELLKQTKPLLSFEVFPPKNETGFESVKSATEEIAKLKPSFMSVTYGAGGGTSEYTTAICKALGEHGVTPLAHLTCVSSDKNRIEAELKKLKEQGIQNILALRGDIPEGFDRTKVHYHHASELMAEIRDFGGFCIGGACYPEGHPESENSARDIEGLRKKVENGCEFLTTQMFFDNNILYNFLYRMYKSGVDVPVVAGIMPVTNMELVYSVYAVAEPIWEQYYTPIIGEEQVEYMIEKFLSPDAIVEQINSGYEYFLFSYDYTFAGFAAIEEGDNRYYWYNNVINTDLAGSGKAGRDNDMSFSKLFELTADYMRTYGDHSIATVAGVSYQNFLYDGSNIANKGFPTDDSKYYQIGNGDASKDYLEVRSYRNSNTLAAAFFRANYNYADKYLVSASVRREGSSRFGINNKWGWFPAVSLGWRISGEDFMRNQDWCNDLKLRAGFGVTGNNLGSDLRSVAMLSNGGTFWYNGQYVYTYGVSQNVNPDLRWEKKYEYNLGFDYSFFNNRVYGSLDAYYRQTRDLLWDYEVPTPPYQYTTLLANAGQMDSYGAELAVSVVPVRSKDFTWITTPTISYNKNYITKLSDPSKGFNYKETTSGGVGENGIMNTQTQILTEGHPVGSFYGYKFAGFKKDGTWMFQTPAGGYKDEGTVSEIDRQIIGSAQPWFTYGWNNMLKYKNFDLALFFRGVVGNKVLNLTRWAYGPQASQSSNVFIKDAVGSNVIYSDKGHFSDYYLEDGSYIKLDNITLGYNYKPMNNKYVENMRFYVTGQNLFTLTKYSGQDPEVNTTGVWDAGIDYCDFYPTVANILIGVNISLY